MCGIIGYTGKKPVRDIILDGLTMLEYRGYDSAGIAMTDRKTGKTDIWKCRSGFDMWHRSYQVGYSRRRK